MSDAKPPSDGNGSANDSQEKLFLFHQAASISNYEVEKEGSRVTMKNIEKPLILSTTAGSPFTKVPISMMTHPEISIGSINIKRTLEKYPSPVWFEYSLTAAPRDNYLECPHCHAKVKHFCKVSHAKDHLVSCKPFRYHLSLLSSNETPQWVTDHEKIRPKLPLNSLENANQRKKPAKELSKEEKKSTELDFATFFYGTATSFSRIENPMFRCFVSRLNPSFKILSRKQLSGRLLDESYAAVKKSVNQALNDPKDIVCLISDGWSSRSGDPVVNYMAISPEFSVLVEANFTKAQRKTSEWISNDIIRIISKIGSTVSDVCMDNETANMSARLDLKSKHLDKYFYGCVSHALHLIVKYIAYSPRFEEKKQMRRRPFNPLPILSANAKTLLYFFKSHKIPGQELKAKQLAASRGTKSEMKSLILPSKTQWGTVLE